MHMHAQIYQFAHQHADVAPAMVRAMVRPSVCMRETGAGEGAVTFRPVRSLYVCVGRRAKTSFAVDARHAAVRTRHAIYTTLLKLTEGLSSAR